MRGVIPGLLLADGADRLLSELQPGVPFAGAAARWCSSRRRSVRSVTGRARVQVARAPTPGSRRTSGLLLPVRRGRKWSTRSAGRAGPWRRGPVLKSGGQGEVGWIAGGRRPGRRPGRARAGPGSAASVISVRSGGRRLRRVWPGVTVSWVHPAEAAMRRLERRGLASCASWPPSRGREVGTRTLTGPWRLPRRPAGAGIVTAQGLPGRLEVTLAARLPWRGWRQGLAARWRHGSRWAGAGRAGGRAGRRGQAG